LGVECLALDTATHLVGRSNPGGILYSGGRDGMLCAWDLGMRTDIRPHRPPLHLTGGSARRWEMMTGWADEDEEDEEDDTLDGDVLGEVSGARRRRTSRPDDPFPYEKSWEVQLDDAEELPVSIHCEYCLCITDLNVRPLNSVKLYMPIPIGLLPSSSQIKIRLCFHRPQTGQ
jgi:hypothetical protein